MARTAENMNEINATEALATAAGKRALEALCHKPGLAALPALTALLSSPPKTPRELAWFLAWAGRLALGPQPTWPIERPGELQATLDANCPQLLSYLGHEDHRVQVAATLPLAACRGHALLVQRAFAARAAQPKRNDLGSALQLASGVLARSTNVTSLIPLLEWRPGDPMTAAHAISRQLDGQRATTTELLGAREWGERALSMLPWFRRDYPTLLRALLSERPLAERETCAQALLEGGPIDSSVVELVFAHRETLPVTTHSERLRSMTVLHCDELTPLQRSVLAARTKYPDRGLAGSIRWPAFRVPMSSVGRSILLGQAMGALSEIVETSLGTRPVYLALLDLLAQATLDKWPPGCHRSNIDQLLSGFSKAQRAELEQAARGCDDLVDATAYVELTGAAGKAWPT